MIEPFTPIENLKLGDRVASIQVPGLEVDVPYRAQYNWLSHHGLHGATPVAARVTSIRFGEHHGFVVINCRLKATAEHPFMICRGDEWGFASAELIQPGDFLIDEHMHEEEVESVVRIDAPNVVVPMAAMSLHRPYFVRICCGWSSPAIAAIGKRPTCGLSGCACDFGTSGAGCGSDWQRSLLIAKELAMVMGRPGQECARARQGNLVRIRSWPKTLVYRASSIAPFPLPQIRALVFDPQRWGAAEPTQSLRRLNAEGILPPRKGVRAPLLNTRLDSNWWTA